MNLPLDQASQSIAAAASSFLAPPKPTEPKGCTPANKPEFGEATDLGKLAAALAKTQAALKFAMKDATNPHFKSKYADLASVWEACREALAANDLAVTQLPSADGAKVTLKTILMHSSGQYISSDLTMTAQQNTPQGIGSTLTYLRRYALASVVGVAQDDDDGNAASKKIP